MIVHFLPYWWVLPVLGTLVGWATNWLAIRMIFEPIEPRKIGRFGMARPVPQAPEARPRTSTPR